MSNTILNHNSNEVNEANGYFQKMKEEVEHSFRSRVKENAWEKSRCLLETAITEIANVEARFMENKSLNADDFYELNRTIAFAFENRHGEDGSYGGYSPVQITHEIRSKEHSVSYTQIWISRAIDEICDAVFRAFLAESNRRIADLKPVRTCTALTGKELAETPDPTARMNAISRLAAKCPDKPGAAYFSFPVKEGCHLTDEDQEDNIATLISKIAAGYGKGYSVFLDAPTGAGKTFTITNRIAPELGRLCDCEVYLAMPNTSQIAQMQIKYKADVRYSDGAIKEEGRNPYIRAYVFDCVGSIPATTERGGITKPIVFIIDEAHTLLTDDDYRKKAMRSVIKKAKEVLSSGGVVLAMTASAEKVSATMPYNDLLGYDLICKPFRVSTKKPVQTAESIIPYPMYSYEEAFTYGKASGIRILNTIPADRIHVMYKCRKDNSIASSLVTVLLDKLKDGRKVIAEINNKAQIAEVRVILENEGYKVTVCSADDKGFKIDEEHRHIYDNPVYDGIINRGEADFTDTDVILTTKLLENGTSIDKIRIEGLSQDELEEAGKLIVTVFVVERRDGLDLEAFEQFAGRVRFRYDEAMLLIPEPEDKKAPDTCVGGRISNDFKRVLTLSEKVRSGIICDSRLDYIDFIGRPDRPEGMGKDGSVTASTIAKALEHAYEDFYKSIMYNEGLFRKTIEERYESKEVVFSQIYKVSCSIKDLRPKIKEEYRKLLSESLRYTLWDYQQRDAILNGYDSIKTEDGTNTKTDFAKTMSECVNTSFVKPAFETLRIASLMQTVDESAKGSETSFNAELPSGISREVFNAGLVDAVMSESKAALNRFARETLASAIRYLKQYGDISEPLKRHSLRYGKEEYNDPDILTDTLVECMEKLKKRHDIPYVKELLKGILESEDMKRIDGLISACPYIGAINMDFYEKFADYSSSQLDEIRKVYEFASFTARKSWVCDDCTSSGATYASVLGREAFEAATGEAYDLEKGILNWKNKRITKDKAEIIHSVYSEIMKKRGLQYDKSIGTGRLKILRLFASAFTFRQEENKDGEAFIVLQSPRRTFPADTLDMIINLTFSKLYRNVEKDSTDTIIGTKAPSDACEAEKAAFSVTMPAPLGSEQDTITITMEDSSGSDDRNYFLVHFSRTKGRIFKLTEDSDVGVMRRSELDITKHQDSSDFLEKIHYINGFSKDYDFSGGHITMITIGNDEYMNYISA